MWPTPLPAATSPFEVVLINPYELGRQPFGLAEPAALLKHAGFAVACLDLSLQKLDPDVLRNARLVAIHVGMHTATRIAVEALPHIQRLAPHAHLCVYGLYAPMNEALLRRLGVGTVLGGEVEPALLSVGQRLRANGTAAAECGTEPAQSEPVVSLGRVPFEVPDRSGLPELSRYAHLVLPDGSTRVSGFVEGSRGCKHLCRHCPVVPVYQGSFRIVPVHVVLEDIAQQVRDGATHVSFGDPDFFNGPAHGLRLARALHDAFPGVTFDATIKIQHLIAHAQLLPSCGAADACSSRPLWRPSTTASCACSPRIIRAATSTARSRSPAPRASRSPRPSSPSPRGRRWMATLRCWSDCWSCNSWRACLPFSYASGC